MGMLNWGHESRRGENVGALPIRPAREAGGRGALAAWERPPSVGAPPCAFRRTKAAEPL